MTGVVYREEEAGSPDLYALLEKTFKPFEDPGQDLHQTMKVVKNLKLYNAL